MLEINQIYNMDCLEGIKQMKQFNIVPDLIVTDPPYEFENKGGGLYSLERTKKMLKKIADIKTHTFDFEKYIPIILDIQKDKINAYFFCNKKLIPKYLNIAIERNLNFDVLVFRKLNPIPAFNNSHMNDLEYIIFMRSKGVYFSSKEGYTNYSKHYAENIGHHGLKHPNQKPLKLISRFIKISCPPNGIVFDPFFGSGTTLLASKQHDRRFIGFERHRNYYEIAIDRLQQNTLNFLK